MSDNSYDTEGPVRDVVVGFIVLRKDYYEQQLAEAHRRGALEACDELMYVFQRLRDSADLIPALAKAYEVARVNIEQLHNLYKTTENDAER